MKTQLKIIIGLLLIVVCSKAYSQQIIHPLQQFDNRIHVKIITDKALKGFKPQSQYIGVEITNKTQDKLQVIVSYYANLTCGSRVYGKNGATESGEFLTPGKTSKADFWSHMNSFNVVDRLAPRCTDNEGLRIKVAENQFSWIQSVGYEIVSIENISEKERLKAKEEKDLKDEETKKKQEEAVRLKAETNAKATSASTSSSNNVDFWDDKPATQTTQKSKQQIEADRKLQESRDRYAEQENRFLNTMAKQKQEQERQDAFSQTSYYLAERKTQAERGVFDNASFNREFENVEDLNRAFREQVSQINASANELAEVKNLNLSNNLNYSLQNTDATTQAVGQGIALIGSIINNASAESDRKYALAKLEKEQKEQVARIEAVRKQKILNLRNDIFKQFIEGGVPLSRHNIKTEELYFFTYTYDGKTNAKVSNVFPYAKYKDGTWAFKDKVKAESEKSTGSKVTLVGYYTTKELAEKERNVFVQLLPQAEVQVTAYTVKGRKWDGAESGSTDFWGNEVKKETQTTTPQKTDDFWGDAPAKTDKKTETKKTDDFWD